MNATSSRLCEHPQYELRFSHLYQSGRGYAFPCDSKGRVDLDGLSDSLRSHYLFARALVGHELSAPVTREAPCAADAQA